MRRCLVLLLVVAAAGRCRASGGSADFIPTTAAAVGPQPAAAAPQKPHLAATATTPKLAVPAGPAAAAAAAAPGRGGAAAAAGACLLQPQAGMQCGGNWSSPAGSCQDFAACTNVAWPRACCPAAAPCAPAGLDACWTCGGAPLPALAAAAAAAPPAMCAASSKGAGAGGDFDYPCVLGAALMFYEAQRSGPLPPGSSSRIPWRGASGLADVGPTGKPLLGGWYDAGDLTKFTFPAAWALGNLALAFLEFPDGFGAAGQRDAALAALRWGADYLVAARYSPDGFVVASWAPKDTIEASHMWWGRPEDVARRPARVLALNGTVKGADVLGQAAGALAAVSLAFAGTDASYAESLLEVASGLYTQAAGAQGLYSSAFPEVAPYYRSYTYIDDLAWAAAWLALATGQPDYVEQARFFWKRHQDEEGGGEGRRYDYNNMIQALGYVMSRADPANKDVYLQPIRTVMDLWLNAKSSITYSPKGMAWIDTWGNLRYVANQAFVGLLHAKAYPSSQPKRKLVYTCFARRQARYMLGDAGQGYVVGVGPKPPCRPHHRGASCGPLDLPCDCGALLSKACNPNVIYGGLVGGPDKDDAYEDSRLNFAQSEVALDWNAGFTGMMAALASPGALPSWQDCVAAGQQDGRGQVSPSLSGALRGAAGGAPLWGALAAAGALAAWAWA